MSLSPSRGGQTLRLGLALIFIFVLGVSVVGIELLFIWMLGPGLPQWSLFTYLIVAFLVGLAYIGGEIMFSPIRRLLVDRDKITDPLWKRSLRLLALLSIVGVLVFVGVLLKQRW